MTSNEQTNSVPRFVVMTAAAYMPASNRYGEYRRVAVVETNGTMPRQIHPRHRSVKRIVATWERLNVGKTPRCAFHRAYRDAQEMAANLNNSNN